MNFIFNFNNKIPKILAICMCISSIYAIDSTNITNKSNAKSSVIDNQNQFIIGIYGGFSTMEMSSNYYNTSHLGNRNENLNGGSYGIKFGYDMYFTNEHGLRIYVDYMNSLFNSKEMTLGKAYLHTIGLNVDYRYSFSYDFSIFAGLGVVHNIINTSHLDNIKRFGGSLNLGLAYAVSFIELEARMRYIMYEIKKDSSYLPTINGKQASLHETEISSPISFHFGINFRF